MTIRERIKAESTELGKFMKTWVAGILTACSAIGALTEYFGMLPYDIAALIPPWLKISVFIAGGISFVYGHLTVKQQNFTITDNGR